MALLTLQSRSRKASAAGGVVSQFNEAQMKLEHCDIEPALGGFMVWPKPEHITGTLYLPDIVGYGDVEQEWKKREAEMASKRKGKGKGKGGGY